MTDKQTDRHTDTARRHRPRLHSISRGKKNITRLLLPVTADSPPSKSFRTVKESMTELLVCSKDDVRRIVMASPTKSCTLDQYPRFYWRNHIWRRCQTLRRVKAYFYRRHRSMPSCRHCWRHLRSTTARWRIIDRSQTWPSSPKSSKESSPTKSWGKLRHTTCCLVSSRPNDATTQQRRRSCATCLTSTPPMIVKKLRCWACSISALPSTASTATSCISRRAENAVNIFIHQQSDREMKNKQYLLQMKMSGHDGAVFTFNAQLQLQTSDITFSTVYT